MIQTALITILLILVVTYLSSPSIEHSKTIEEKKETVKKVERTEIVQIKVAEAVQPKVKVMIPGIPTAVALPKAPNVVDIEDAEQLFKLWKKEKALKEEALEVIKTLKSDLEQNRENEAQLKAQLDKVAKMAEIGERQARAYEENTKRKIQSLEKNLLENMHYKKELQSKIESFPVKVDELVTVAEEISDKAETEFETLLSEKETLEKEVQRLKNSQK